MKYLLLGFLAILEYRFAFCVSGLLRTNYYEKKYFRYLKGQESTFLLYVAPTQKLFRQAHVTDSKVPHCAPIGYGKVMTMTVSVFDNLANKRQDVAALVMTGFQEAKGYFRMGVLECLSPLYWVQLIIFLPVKLCELSGISGDKLAVKIIQIIYWGLTPLFLCFRTEMYDFVIHLLQKM